MFTFEDLTQGTTVQNQYTGQGVTFINSGGQLLPVIHRISTIPIIGGGGIVANVFKPGNNVANFATCFACEFYVPNAAAVLSPACQAIEMGVGYEPNSSTPNDTAKITLSAFGTSIKGGKNVLIGQQTATVTAGQGFGTILRIQSSQKNITSFTITGDPNSDIDKQLAFDNLKIIYDVSRPAVITWATPADITYGTPLGANQLNATADTAGTFAYDPAPGTVLKAGTAYTLTVSFTPADTVNYQPTSSTVLLNVLPAAPVITWANPADISYGTPLSTAQLNATANVPGTFTYDPPTGKILPAGANIHLSAAFTPTDTHNYLVASKTVTINVNKATPVITWSNPAAVVYGTALSGVQLNASANVPGTFTYVPPAGTILHAGAQQTLTANFVPNDTANYLNGTATVAISVTKATPTITWANPSDITYGTALGGTQLNASANVAGTFVYNPPAGTLLTPGANQVLNVTFTPTDASNYSPATASAHINVNKAAPAIAWANPPDITYGIALSAAQLNATANVPGTFAYSPAVGAVLNAGANQSLTATFTPTDAAKYATANRTVTINVNKATPTISWSNPANITYGTALGAAQLNAAANVPGSFSYSPPTGAILSAGSNQSLTGAFTPTDTANYLPANASVLINVDKATPNIAWGSPADIIYGTPLGAAQLNATANVPGTFAYSPAGGVVLNAGANQSLTATFTPTDAANYAAANRTVTINVNKATPTISWNNPADITYGAALGAAQLNATANVPGSFSYSPGTGAILNAGSNQSLTATFTPTDTANYLSANASVLINVNKATPSISWANPPDITYGTALSAAQLNATANIPGSFVYSPAAGAVPNAGANQSLTATFTPTDAANYATANHTVTINVNKARPVISWSNPVDITYGTVLGAAQLNATANVPGTFSYSPGMGAILNAGSNQALTATFTPTDAANYLSANASVLINVNKATPTISWSSPADITYGTPLGAAQLNATADIPGTLSYAPGSGTIPSAGLQVITATFTPNDSANYNATTKSVTLNVNKAVPVITWQNPADVSVGTFLTASQLDAAANVPGTFSYTPAIGVLLTAGASQSLTATFTPADPVDYTGATKSVTINVNKAATDIFWNSPADITYGTPLSPVQLNATASIPGTFSYSPPLGTVLPAGNAVPLTATFTPNDAVNYSAATKVVNLNVAKATPVITWSPLDITIGFPVGLGQLNATAHVPGTFSYSLSLGTMLLLGNNQPITANFTPADTLNYNSVSQTVNVNVVEFRIYINGNSHYIQVEWPPGEIQLEEADHADGPWQPSPGISSSPLNTTPSGTMKFFRLHR